VVTEAGNLKVNKTNKYRINVLDLPSSLFTAARLVGQANNRNFIDLNSEASSTFLSTLSHGVGVEVILTYHKTDERNIVNNNVTFSWNNFVTANLNCPGTP